MGYTVYYKSDSTFLDKFEVNYNAFERDMEILAKRFAAPIVWGDHDWDIVELIQKKTNYQSRAAEGTVFEFSYTNKEVMIQGPHETFSSPSATDHEFNFCKTARKPYDIIVKLAHLITAKHFGGTISHDGDIKDFLREEWQMYDGSDCTSVEEVINECQLQETIKKFGIAIP